jgi:hypothetical protein
VGSLLEWPLRLRRCDGPRYARRAPPSSDAATGTSGQVTTRPPQPPTVQCREENSSACSPCTDSREFACGSVPALTSRGASGKSAGKFWFHNTRVGVGAFRLHRDGSGRMRVLTIVLNIRPGASSSKRPTKRPFMTVLNSTPCLQVDTDGWQ